MKELFEKKGHSIFIFKKGDIIIRLKPRIIKELIYNENLGISVSVDKDIDNSFRTPMEFIAIENNRIYLKYVKPDPTGERRITSANLEDFSDDWDLFVVPAVF
jgi:hypothetical protein